MPRNIPTKQELIGLRKWEHNEVKNVWNLTYTNPMRINASGTVEFLETGAFFAHAIRIQSHHANFEGRCESKKFGIFKTIELAKDAVETYCETHAGGVYI